LFYRLLKTIRQHGSDCDMDSVGIILSGE